MIDTHRQIFFIKELGSEAWRVFSSHSFLYLSNYSQTCIKRSATWNDDYLILVPKNKGEIKNGKKRHFIP